MLPARVDWSGSEAELIARVRDLPFREFEFHCYPGKRRVLSFGWHYDFSGCRPLKTDYILDYLLALRVVTAAFADLEPEEFQHVLVTEYGPGAGIGCHRDKAVFGEVVGISLLSPCLFRIRQEVTNAEIKFPYTILICGLLSF